MSAPAERGDIPLEEQNLEIQETLNRVDEFLATLPSLLFSERKTMEELKLLFEEIKALPQDIDQSSNEIDLHKLFSFFKREYLIDPLANAYNRYYLAAKGKMSEPIINQFWRLYHKTLDAAHDVLRNDILRIARDRKLQELQDPGVERSQAQIQDLIQSYFALQEKFKLDQKEEPPNGTSLPRFTPRTAISDPAPASFDAPDPTELSRGHDATPPPSRGTTRPDAQQPSEPEGRLDARPNTPAAANHNDSGVQRISLGATGSGHQPGELAGSGRRAKPRTETYYDIPWESEDN